MPSYKLYYFPIKGRAEVIRLLFAQAGVEFEDIRITFEDWPARKHEMPFGQMPVLEVDGKTICQSAAIGRYLAREFNLVGKDSFTTAKSEEISEAVLEIMMKLPWKEQDEEKKKALMATALNETVLPMLAKLERRCAGDFYAGEFTAGDIVFASSAEHLLSLKPDIMDPTPKLKALKERVFAMPNIAKYLATRSTMH